MSFVYWVSPLGLGFSDSASGKLQLPILMMVYYGLHLGSLVTVFGLVPLSVSLASRPSNRRLAFQVLLLGGGCVSLLQIGMLVYLSA